jgi:hypothetical protein
MIPALADAAGKAGTSLRHGVAAPPPGNNYYVAPGGNDAWSGTLTAPFGTLSRAKAAMRSSAIKTTYLRAGVYSIVSRLQFTSQDSNQALLAYPGEQPVLEGGGVGGLDLYGGHYIKIQGLKFQKPVVAPPLDEFLQTPTKHGFVSILENFVACLPERLTKFRRESCHGPRRQC